jgi:hypothetical protein
MDAKWYDAPRPPQLRRVSSGAALVPNPTEDDINFVDNVEPLHTGLAISNELPHPDLRFI